MTTTNEKTPNIIRMVPAKTAIFPWKVNPLIPSSGPNCFLSTVVIPTAKKIIPKNINVSSFIT